MPTHSEKPYLLIVDDDKQMRSIISLQLQQFHYQLATAENGLDALSKIRQRRPDLIISDILMPELDGFGLCLAVREDPELAHIPFIFLTGHYLAAEDEQLGLRMGATAYLVKSPQLDNLPQVVEKSLATNVSEEQRLHREFPELAELAKEEHLQRLFAQLYKKVLQLSHSEAAFALSEARYRSILEAAPDSILVADKQGSITLVNERSQQLLGYSREQLIGRKLNQLVDLDNESTNRSAPDQGQNPLYRGVAARCKNGKSIPVEMSVSRLKANAQETTTTILRDIRQRLYAENRIVHLNRIHQLLSRCNQALVKCTSEQAIVEEFCQQIVQIGGYALAWVGYPQASMSSVCKVVAIADAAGQAVDACDITCIEQGAISQVLDQQQALVFEQAELSPQQQACLSRGTTSEICRYKLLPLTDKGVVFGVLVIGAGSCHAFEAEDESSLLSELAGDLAYGIRMLRKQDAHQKTSLVLNLRERALDAARNGIVLIEAGAAEGYPATYVNPAFSRITGYHLEEVALDPLGALIGQDTEQAALEQIDEALLQQRSIEIIVRSYRKDGIAFWNELELSPIRDESGRISHFVMVISDVSERIEQQESLEHRTYHDALTQLPNRVLLNDRLEQALKYSRRHLCKSAVLFIDLDRFKHVNDSLGHDAGDKLLCEMARRISVLVRQGDTVARWGGDEFVLVLPDIKHRDEVSEIASRILFEIQQPFQVNQHLLTVGCSIGCSFYPDDESHIYELLKYADAAMYRAKKLGGDQIQFFEATFNELAQQRFRVESELRQALRSQQLVIYYQPIVDLKTGKICSAEALIRWNHAEHGLVFPGDFIEIAEESGLIVEIGNLVIDSVCQQLKKWQDLGLPLKTVGINVAAKQFADAELHLALAKRVATVGINPASIVLELTENVLIQDHVETHENLRLLKNLGFCLALDDFGTGYSSLGYLRRFPVNRIKIDQSFIKDLATDPECANLVMIILSIADNFRCKVIAEGVEKREQLRFLQAKGCDYMQGFLFSPALPADQFEEMVLEGKTLELEF